MKRPLMMTMNTTTTTTDPDTSVDATISGLPVGVAVHILGYLDDTELCNVDEANVLSDPTIWRDAWRLCRRSARRRQDAVDACMDGQCDWWFDLDAEEVLGIPVVRGLQDQIDRLESERSDWWFDLDEEDVLEIPVVQDLQDRIHRLEEDISTMMSR
jgi:hypothetical protein